MRREEVERSSTHDCCNGGIYSLLPLLRLPNQIRTLDFKDTFLSLEHLQDSLPQYEVQVGVVMWAWPVAWIIHVVMYVAA